MRAFVWAFGADLAFRIPHHVCRHCSRGPFGEGLVFRILYSALDCIEDVQPLGRIPYSVLRIRIPTFRTGPCIKALGRIPYSVFRIRIPY